MRHCQREVSLNNIELTSPRFSWAWNSNEFPPHSTGYRVWYVFSGSLMAEGLDHRWQVTSGCVVHMSRDREPMTLMGQPKRDVTLGIIDYQESKPSPRIASQCWKVQDSDFMETLIKRAYQRASIRQVWEANTLLEAMLDEIFLGEVILPNEREASFDPRTAHHLTQAKLKNINWASTQRIPVFPRTDGF